METLEDPLPQIVEATHDNVNGLADEPLHAHSDNDDANSEESDISGDEAAQVQANGFATNGSDEVDNVMEVDDELVNSAAINTSDCTELSKEDYDDDMNESSPLEISDPGTDNSALSLYPDGMEHSESMLAATPTNKDNLSLPECRTKRSYVCGYCNMKTINPREYLYHLKDEHGEDLRIFSCDRCQYASKSVQKINRHNQMVHKMPKPPSIGPSKKPPRSKEEIEKPTPVVKKTSPISVAPMNRSPRESKSPRRYEEFEFTEDLDLEQELPPKPVAKAFACAQCNFSTKFGKVLTKHEAKCHLKKKFFKCSRCSYATHLKSRFTKHMKYHKLPVVKCDFCDFSTPYRWNLDRHMKNHNREGGLLQCHLCNFKAQIKQSLTVHIANHHVSQVKFAEQSDVETCEDMTEEEMEMLRMERDEDPDALEVHSNSPSFRVSNYDLDKNDSELNSDHSNDEEYDDEPLETQAKKPKIKMTIKLPNAQKDTGFMATNERHNFQDDFVHPDDVVHRHGNVYLKTEKCKHCPFKAPFQIEVLRHMKKVHSASFKTKVKRNKKLKGCTSSYKTQKIKREQLDSDDDAESFSEDKDEFADDYQNDSGKEVEFNSLSSSKDLKKKPSFFEKLQEKLTMNNVENLVCQFCGHESKCLSESVRHQKLHLSAKNNYASPSLSTRCQFCRHRCKTTDDLVNHLKSCSEARKNQLMENEKEQRLSQRKQDVVAGHDDKHPMENRVFVWNNPPTSSDADKSFKAKSDLDDKSIVGAESTHSEASYSQDGSGCNTDHEAPNRRRKLNKVYKCPKCTFSSGTASRFHVHIVGHLNKKPYTCSDCGYCSNWRWDITKHIKVKVSRKDNHKDATVLISDILDERNYEKYDKYLTIPDRKGKSVVSLAEGKRKRIKRILEDDDTDSSKSSPCPTPINKSSPTGRLPAPPKLTRAPPSRKSVGSASRKRTIEPIIAGSQMASSQMKKATSENGPTDPSDKKYSMKPPPLVAMGAVAQLAEQNGLSRPDSKAKGGDSDENNSNYQIITEQGALNTNLETLQLFASGNTNLSFLKNLQSLAGEGDSSDADVLSNQDGGENNSEQQSKSDIMQLVLDHEGNPEWKCSACDFRDSEQETVVQHVSLAHSKKGPVSLLHAVHRCNVCGFAAGTKRHVLLHIETSHGGQGGIISRSEGQNIEQDKTGEEHSRSLTCRICPFTCKKQSEYKKHMGHHSEKPDCVFKCVMCPFYVATKNELFEHFNVHNSSNPAAAPKENNSTFLTPEPKPNSQDENSPREFVCDLCPFETRSRAKLVHHRQFHRPRGLPYSCPKCSYNVTRQHLLTQHLRIHGIVSTEGNNDASATSHTTNGTIFSKANATGSKSPSPSLTITPISSARDDFKKSTINPACLPTLSDELTKNLHDIPLVWVSKDSKFFKMFKCRHCPHVNLRKTNIQEHEKMHRCDNLPPGVGHKCQFCTYICINAGVMTSHLKVHSGAMGKCHAIVDQALPNEDQLYMLAGASANYRSGSPSGGVSNEIKKSDEKRLYYCQICPGRFFFEKEVVIHSRFHSTASTFTNHCGKCNFTVRDAQQLISHAKVHTPEYQERTHTLMTMHPSAPSHPPVAGNSVSVAALKLITNTSHFGAVAKDNGMVGGAIKPNGLVRNSHTSSHMPQPPPTSRFKCDKCPSTFTKQITLQYHQSLHSANNPFKCAVCSYAAKTQSHLDQHVALHDTAEREKTLAAATQGPPAVTCSPAKSSSIRETLGMLRKKSTCSVSESSSYDPPPIKLKLLKGDTSGGHTKKQFKYYIEEQVPLSGIDLLKRKNQIEREMPKDTFKIPKLDVGKSYKPPPTSNKVPRAEDRVGNPNFHYPLHIDRSCGKTKERRYKCRICPAAFEKLDQFNVHHNLHGSNFKYKCKMCDYSVKFYANFMMHIKRHKYHEKMDAQAKGMPEPSDDDPRFQPFIGEKQITARRADELPPSGLLKAEAKSAQKENRAQFDPAADMTTSEKQHLILLQKKGECFKTKEDEVDRKVFYCQHCPYANTRRDGVDSHSLRHGENNGRGVYMCHFCDYTAAQPNFIREHTKVHFRPFKYVQPAGFMRHDKLEIFGICSADVAESSGGGSSKRLVMSHEDGVYQPPVKRMKLEDDPQPAEAAEPSESAKTFVDDCSNDNGICVDFRSGDVVDAPSQMK